MKVSIFTPSHDTKFLLDLYNSIKDQDFFEWVIVLNGKALERKDEKIFDDRRVKYIYASYVDPLVGHLKKIACDHCTGDILLEVDHDDLLTPTAVQEVKNAFENDSEVGFVYSNCAEFEGNFAPRQRFDPAHGWKYRPFTYRGHELEECISFEPSPATVSRIWYAPNHLRAWRKSVYDLVGGYNPEMRVLDDQDLMCRTYLNTKMKHINKCLYLYRVHGENSWIKYNKEIQDNTMRIHREYISRLALKWAFDNNLKRLDFGGGINPEPGYDAVDISLGTDLEKPFPWADNSVGVIRAYDFLEHLHDKLHVIKEIYRVLAPGGYLLALTPCALSQGAYQDPTHVSFYVENSFKYYTEHRFAKYIGVPVRFQAMSLFTTKPNADGVAWIVAQLIALKGQEFPGIVNI